MKRDWRYNEVQLLTQMKRMFAIFEGELVQEFQIGAGTRSDLLLRTVKAAYVVEVKGASAEEYLSFATWGQMTMYKKVIESWHKPEALVVLVLFTNANISDDLRAVFEKSKIVVVEAKVGEDLTYTRQKLERALEKLGLPIPEVKVGSGLPK